MSLFHIENLKCSYNGGSTVLEVENLSISSGKLIVIIGLSGAGKSTFLETLGLMNNTINKDSVIKFSPTHNELYEFENLWENNNDMSISEVRRRHFSFIFQSTNLMPNFTVYENICLTQMMQGNAKMDAMNTSDRYMKQLGLEEIDEKKNSFEISGGQAQRVAFVRAITPKFTVLFGDEPTGNLDEKNSWDLMGVLKDNIHQSDKTAIIVTHNIKLALDFADQIILITKPNSHGVIESKNIFHKIKGAPVWKNNNDEFDDKSMKKYLKKTMYII